MVRAGSLEVLLSLLKNASYDTVGAAIAALRNLSIHDSNAVCTIIIFTVYDRSSLLLHTLSVCFLQKAIIDSGFLPELSQLLILQRYPEIQYHAAGTIRNLATEELSRVHLHWVQEQVYGAWSDWFVLTKKFYLSLLQSLVVLRVWQRSSETTPR